MMILQEGLTGTLTGCDADSSRVVCDGDSVGGGGDADSKVSVMLTPWGHDPDSLGV